MCMQLLLFSISASQESLLPINLLECSVYPRVHSSFAATWLPWCEIATVDDKKLWVTTLFCVGAESV